MTPTKKPIYTPHDRVANLRNRLSALDRVTDDLHLALCGDGCTPCDVPGMEGLKDIYIVGQSSTGERAAITAYASSVCSPIFNQCRQQLEVDLLEAEQEIAVRRAVSRPTSQLTEMEW